MNGDEQTALLTAGSTPIYRQSGWRAQAMLACLAVLALLMAGASLFAYRSAEQRDAAEQVQVRTRALLDASARLKVAILNSARGERGYVVTGDRNFLEPYTASQPEIVRQADLLEELTRSQPGSAPHVQKVAAILDRYGNWQAKVISLESEGKHTQAVARIATGEGRRMIEALLTELNHIELNAQASLAASNTQSDSLARNSELYQYGLTMVGLLLLVLSALATFAVRRSIDAEAHAREELRRHAMTDDLTGIANRRELLASLDRAVAGARRTRRPLALAVLDIDHFKRINDTHGHPAGDAVIRRIALLAVDVMRGQDTVGRLGGEEFAVVLPDCTADAAYAACERLRMAVRDTDLEMETGHDIYVTLSIGITVFEHNDSAEAMIARADAALYRAKHSGRDRVKLAA